MQSAKIKGVRSWLIAIIVLVVGLLTLELFLRSFVYVKNGNTLYDPDLQWQNMASTRNFQAIEGSGTTYYVADGEIATPYTGGESIVILGDSYTEGFQVNDNEKYPSVAEKLLHDRGIIADLHNLGRSDLYLPDLIYRFEYYNQQYKPEIIVLQLNYQNLISNRIFETNQVNYFIQNPDTTLLLKHTPLISGHQYSPFLKYLQRNFSLISYGYKRFSEIEQIITDKLSPSVETQRNLSSDPGYDRRVIIAQISVIRKEFAGKKLVIILTPHFPCFDQNEIILDDPHYDEALILFKNVPEWTVIDPSAAFVNLLKTDRLPRGFNNTLPGNGHWNMDGHAIVGRLLADALEKVLR